MSTIFYQEVTCLKNRNWLKSMFQQLLVQQDFHYGKITLKHPFSSIRTLRTVLLSKLVKSITPQLQCRTFQLFLWSDSSIVLAWLKKPPYTWKAYVANRTSTILGNTENK